MDQRDQIKQKIDIVELVGQYVPLKKAGRNHKALCPFHSEKTPSFMVSQELQIYKCFGCQKGGDIFSFLMEIEGMDFSESLKNLAERAGVKLRSYKPSPAQKQKETLFATTHLVSQFYHYILTEHDRGEPGRQFLKKRGISKNSIKKFQLGFAPDSPTLIHKNLVQKKKLETDTLIKTGISFKGRRGELIDRFYGRVIFPLFDHRGQVVGITGRLLPGDTRDTGKYVNTPETPIYHKSQILYGYHLTRPQIAKTQTAIVVEGQMDAISSYQIGTTNVVAINGTALTNDQTRLLSRTAQDIVLALDNDPAGIDAAWRGIAQAQSVGLTIKIADITPYKDPDEAAQADPKKYQKQLATAQPIFDFYLTSLKRKFAEQPESERKRKIARTFLEKLSKEPDEIIRSHYCKRLAKTLKVSEESVINQLNRTTPETKSPSPSPAQPPSSQDRQEKLEFHLLKLIFQERPQLLQTLNRHLLTHPGHLRLFNLAKAHFVKNKSFDPQAFLKTLPEELKDLLSQVLLDQLPSELHKTRPLKLEIGKTVNQLTQIVTKREISQLTEQLKQAEKDKKVKLQKKLKEQLTQASKKLAQSP